MLGFGANQAVRLAGNLVLTRLLMPEAFGVMAIAWLVMTGLQMISDTGVRTCIVQSRNGDARQFLDTAWSIQVARGALLTAAALAIAAALELARRLGALPPASVYAEPQLPLAIAAIGASGIFGGLESTKLASAYRHLCLARVTMIDLGTQVAGFLVTVGWALAAPSLWALVAGVLVVGPLRVAATHWALPGPLNRWRWDGEAVREIVAFGRWVVLSSLLSFAATSGDRLVLGSLVDPGTLGQYAMAVLIVAAIQQLVNAIIGNVAFPALSEVRRTRPEHLREVFYRLRMPADVLLLGLAGVLFACGSAITGILYDERYRLAGPALEVLSLSLVAFRCELATQCYLALGLPALNVRVNAVRLLPLFAGTPIAFHYGGMHAAIWMIALAPLAAVPVHLYQMRRLGLLDVKRELAFLPCLLLGYLAGRLIAP
jgi:O-antigen/teichoic acid export membrane protein